MITLTNGRIQTQGGMAIPDGSIAFQLNIDANVAAAPGGLVFAAQVQTFQFDSNGNLVQPARIYSNAELNPQNGTGLGTFYLVTLFDANGARLNKIPMNWQFPESAGSTVDISQMVPYVTVGGNVIFYPVNSVYPSVGSAQINNFANPATLNLSTAGVRDWLAPNGTTTIPRQLATPHAKTLREGAGLLNTFDWVYGQNTGSTTLTTGNFTHPSMSSTVSDDLGVGGLTAQVGGQLIQNNSTATGFGFRVIVPADSFARTLTLYCGIFSCVVTVTVSISDGSFAPKTITFDSGSAALVEEAFQIIYNSGRDGQSLMVDVLCSTNHGSTPYVKFGAATLA